MDDILDRFKELLDEEMEKNSLKLKAIRASIKELEASYWRIKQKCFDAAASKFRDEQ